MDCKLVAWHSVYTVILALWGLALSNPRSEFGQEAGYWVLGLGVLPSLVLLVLAVRRSDAAYVAAMLWGAVVALLSLVLTVIAYGFLWVVALFPLFGFVIEALYLHWRWPMIRLYRAVK